jgi:hypothetical protein
MKKLILLLMLVAGPVFGSPAEDATECFQAELDLWEATKGRLPTDDEADLIIDMCMKKAYEEAKK